MKTQTKTELAQIIAELLGHVGERVRLSPRGGFVQTKHPVNAVINRARRAICAVELEAAGQEQGLSPAEIDALLAD
jgi:hypothetical protein